MTVPTNPPATPIGYDALRLGADWASAVRGTTLFFGYADGRLQMEPEPVGVLGSASTVPVRTSLSAAHRPTVEAVELTLTPVGAAVPASLKVEGPPWSALFWSESALEKFLLPYYASAAGAHAAAVLSAISQVWYGSGNAGGRQVCALAFSYAPFASAGPLSIWDTLEVIYYDPAEPTALQAVPLPQFLAWAGPMVLTDVPLGSFDGTPLASSQVATLIDSLGAREVAEFVSGVRGDTVAVYARDIPGGLEARVESDRDSRESPAGTPLFTASAPALGAGRPTVTAQMQVDGVWRPLLPPEPGPSYVPDSVFWTDGAVEMLLLPYYASVMGSWSPLYLAVLLGKWSGAIPWLLIEAAELLAKVLEHVGRLVAAAGGEAARLMGEVEAFVDALDDDTSSDVFAIVHLPRSEYVDESGMIQPAFRVENRLWFLTPEGGAPLVSPGTPLVGARRVTA